MAGQRTPHMSCRDALKSTQPRICTAAERALLGGPEPGIVFADSFCILNRDVIIGHDNYQCSRWDVV